MFADIFKNATDLIRSSINTHADEFKEIICSPDFPFEVKGTSLKNVPKEFSPDHPMAQYLKYKSWYIEHPIDDSLLENTDQFIAEAVTTFLKMQPFHDFLNNALRTFKMPQR